VQQWRVALSDVVALELEPRGVNLRIDDSVRGERGVVRRVQCAESDAESVALLVYTKLGACVRAYNATHAREIQMKREQQGRLGKSPHHLEKDKDKDKDKSSASSQSSSSSLTSSTSPVLEKKPIEEKKSFNLKFWQKSDSKKAADAKPKK